VTRTFQALFAAAAALLLTVSPANAQTNAEINAGIQFDFSNPGARSLGVAGAFIALGDDATTAFANPAGLTNLSRPEVSLEARHWGYKNEFLNRGNALGTPTGIGFDTVNGLEYGVAENTADSISFGSFVYPQPTWAVAIYRSTVANFKNSYQSSGPFLGTGLPRLFPVIASSDTEITSLGGTIAVKVHPTLSVGAGVSSYHYEGGALTTRYQVRSFYENPNYASNNVLVDLAQSGDSRKVSFNAGALWKPTGQVSLGGIFRKGAAFDLELSSELGPGHPAFPQPVNRFTGEFHVPDVYGFGIAVKPVEPVTISFDVKRVLYSQLTEGFRDLLNRPRYTEGFEASDGNELRFGAQYLIPTLRYPVAVRGGVWRDPDHRVRYTGDPNVSTDFGDRIEKRSFQLLFTEGEGTTHVAIGAGIAVGAHFQADFGFDHSDLVNAAAVSLVARF
jgi:long-chain fatty acid transport protein